MCKRSNYIHKMLLNTRGAASIVFLVRLKILAGFRVRSTVWFEHGRQRRPVKDPDDTRSCLPAFRVLKRNRTTGKWTKEASLAVLRQRQLWMRKANKVNAGHCSRRQSTLHPAFQICYETTLRWLTCPAMAGCQRRMSNNLTFQINIMPIDEVCSFRLLFAKSRWHQQKNMQTLAVKCLGGTVATQAEHYWKSKHSETHDANLFSIN